MSILTQSIFVVDHQHTPTGRSDHFVDVRDHRIVQNPLYRPLIERILSYLPIFSTFTGIRTLLGIPKLETAFLIQVDGLSDICSLSPCSQINQEIPSIRKAAWLEIFGIKAIVTIYNLILKVTRFFIAYYQKVFRGAALDIYPVITQDQERKKTAQEEIDDFLGHAPEIIIV
ncbi:hypothetical protein [Chlamydia vaughanii]|uniref:hypothetical protein n=1 Tax=Chlamydia vaughanii TaxID=3112552 RepID=UPI0039F49F28